MASGWRQSPLGNVIELKRGYDLPKRDRIPGKTPVVSSSGTTDWHSEAKVRGPGVVTGRYGTLGEIYFIQDDFWPLNTALYVRDFKGNDPRFISYFLRGLDFSAYSDKAAVPGLNRNHLHEAIVRYPMDIEEQRRIAHILGTLDDKIELNLRMNQTLEEMTRAIFKDWFVDFGPVRAKLEGREPYLPPELWDLFPDRLADSELDEIPEGWEVKALDEIADYRNGLALQKFRPAENEERLPVVKIAQLRAGKPDGDEWAKASITPDCIIDDGDVVFSWSGSLLIKVWCGGPAALNQHLFKVTSRQYPKWFYLHSTESHLPAFQAIAAGKTTTMGHIKREHLKEAKCAVPDAALMTAVGGILAELLAKTVLADVESRALAAQRDALLPRLISGELRVGTAECTLEVAK
ncbi:MAG: restriction endonuclease subunit S [Chloroflexi bacterium]|nr:restriction endonuclease subunit S [Chloroflexota bacterium]